MIGGSVCRGGYDLKNVEGGVRVRVRWGVT